MNLESKSEYIVEKNIYHLVIFQKCFCLWWYYLQTKIYVKYGNRGKTHFSQKLDIDLPWKLA